MEILQKTEFPQDSWQIVPAAFVWKRDQQVNILGSQRIGFKGQELLVDEEAPAADDFQP